MSIGAPVFFTIAERTASGTRPEAPGSEPRTDTQTECTFGSWSNQGSSFSRRTTTSRVFDPAAAAAAADFFIDSATAAAAGSAPPRAGGTAPPPFEVSAARLTSFSKEMRTDARADVGRAAASAAGSGIAPARHNTSGASDAAIEPVAGESRGE